MPSPQNKAFLLTTHLRGCRDEREMVELYYDAVDSILGFKSGAEGVFLWHRGPDA
jgi:hypothetical protein